MATATGPGLDQFLPTRQRRRADGTTVLCGYFVVLFAIPSHLILAGLPLAVAPSVLVGVLLGLLWLCAHLVDTTGMAKGRSLVRSALFLFVLSQLATYGYATYTYLPFDELNATDRSVLTILALAMVGIFVVDAVRGMAQLDRLLRAIVLGCAFVALIGLFQFFVGIDLTKYMVLPGLRPTADVNTLLARSVFRRPSGTAGHPIEFGVVCAIATPLAAHYAFRAKTLRARGLAVRTWPWWLCLLIVGVGAMVSLSRSAILGLLAAGIVLLPTWPGRRRVQALLVAVGFVGAMRLAVPGLVGTLFSLFNNLSTDPSIQHRTEDYARADIQIALHPILGRGYGTYLPNKYGPLDNQYLGTLVENGYVGLAVLILLLVSGLYAAFRSRRVSRDPIVRDLGQTLIASLMVAIVAFGTYDAFGFFMGTSLVFVLLGACGVLWRTLRANPDTTTLLPEGSHDRPTGATGSDPERPDADRADPAGVRLAG